MRPQGRGNPFRPGFRPQDHGGDQPCVSGGIPPRFDHGVPNVGVASNGGLDLSELHPKPSDLHLAISASDVRDATIRKELSHVARPIHAFAGVEGIRQESFGGEVLAVPVSAGNSVAGDEDLRRKARRHGVKSVVQYVNARVRDRPPYRNGRIVTDRGLAHLFDTRPDRGLRRAVHVPERARRRADARRQLGGQRFASAERLQTAISGPAGREEHLPGRGRSLEHGRSAFLDEAAERDTVE